jgi:hypothetical protein
LGSLTIRHSGIGYHVAQINKNINKMFNKPSEKTNSFKFMIINIPGLRINYISMDAEMIVGLHLASTV